MKTDSKQPIFADRVFAFFAPLSWDPETKNLSPDLNRLERRPWLFLLRNMPLGMVLAYVASGHRGDPFIWAAVMLWSSTHAMVGHAAIMVIGRKLLEKYWH